MTQMTSRRRPRPGPRPAGRRAGRRWRRSRPPPGGGPPVAHGRGPAWRAPPRAGAGARPASGRSRRRRPGRRPRRGTAAPGATARTRPGPGTRRWPTRRCRAPAADGWPRHCRPRGPAAGAGRRGRPPRPARRRGAGCRPTRTAGPPASRRDRRRSRPRPGRAAVPSRVRRATARSRYRRHIVRASGAREPSRLIRGSDSTAAARSPSSRQRRSTVSGGQVSATRSPARSPASRNGRAAASSSSCVPTIAAPWPWLTVSRSAAARGVRGKRRPNCPPPSRPPAPRRGPWRVGAGRSDPHSVPCRPESRHRGPRISAAAAHPAGRRTRPNPSQVCGAPW